MSVPIGVYATANEELASKTTEVYYSCCGKSICGGCVYSFVKSGNSDKCPYCKADNIAKQMKKELKN
jgi:rubrerythrin